MILANDKVSIANLIRSKFTNAETPSNSLAALAFLGLAIIASNMALAADRENATDRANIALGKAIYQGYFETSGYQYDGRYKDWIWIKGTEITMISTVAINDFSSISQLCYAINKRCLVMFTQSGYCPDEKYTLFTLDNGRESRVVPFDCYLSSEGEAQYVAMPEIFVDLFHNSSTLKITKTSESLNSNGTIFGLAGFAKAQEVTSYFLTYLNK